MNQIYLFKLTLLIFIIFNLIQLLETKTILKSTTLTSILNLNFIASELKINKNLVFFILSDCAICFLQFSNILILFLTLIDNSKIPFTLFGLLSTILILIRFRGAFNGGSDAISTHIWIGLTISSLGYLLKNNIGIGLAYIGFISIYSYFKAGFVKLIQKQWLEGNALGEFYFYSPRKNKLVFNYLNGNKKVSIFLSLLTITWEITFPLILVNKMWAIYYLTIGIIFHFVIYFIFGLNRFLWAWICTYPSIIYLCINPIFF